jgi:hypothetical protein
MISQSKDLDSYIFTFVLWLWSDTATVFAFFCCHNTGAENVAVHLVCREP